MTRSPLAWQRWQANRATEAYVRQRAWHWAAQGNDVLAVDYLIRLLNQRPRDPLGLLLGEVTGHRAGQPVFAEKCTAALRRLRTQTGTSSAVALLQGTPSGEAVAALLRERADTAAGEATAARPDERLTVKESEPLASLQAAVRRSALRTGRTALAEALEPPHSTYGRGLYATQRIASRSPILMDQPLLVQRFDETRCAHCLAPLPVSDTHEARWPCAHCTAETYCGPACREAAWEQYHGCCCASRNPAYAAWWEAMRETLRRGGSADSGGSEARAALACLAVAKLCAVATIQSCHPLALPGLAGLRGTAEYEPATALSEIGALAVALATALRQPRLFMEEVLSLFAVLQTNEWLVPGGIALFPVLSLLNHSCEPNTAVVTGQGPSQAQLVALRDIRDGEQLMVNYNAHLTTSLDYEQRRALCAQRHFECFCAKCIRRQ